MTTLHMPFIPGRLMICTGRSSDYKALEHFHYRTVRPATWAGVWVVRYCPDEPTEAERNEPTVAVGVLSYPVPTLRARDRFFNMIGCSYGDRLRFANRNIRTISRVIVHPQFRSLGLAAALVRQMCAACPTRYIEAMAVMGRAHPLFERAGMTRIDPDPPDETQPIYYILDRHSTVHVPSEPGA